MVKVSDKVAFAGDWHGDADWAERVIVWASERDIDTIFHAGDFGFWPGVTGKMFVLSIERACEKYGITMAVTPGNHEDWSRLDEKKAKDKGDGWGAVKHMTDHIIVLPRAHRVKLEYSGGSRSLVSLGGAPSIDFPSRREWHSWWKSEAITMSDVEATVAGGHADIMVAHDSPDSPWCTAGVKEIIYSPDSRLWWTESGLRYAKEGRDLMHMAYEGVMPKMFFHGHYHEPGSIKHKHGEVWSLGMQRQYQNVVYLNLDSMKVN